MPLITYSTTQYIWLTIQGRRSVCKSILDPTDKGYCSECGTDVGIQYYWFLIQPKQCEKCGHKFSKQVSGSESCEGHYEYADRQLSEIRAELAREMEERYKE